MRLGGQTPILSSVELYDRLKEELPEFVKDLSDKGNFCLQACHFRELTLRSLGIIGRQYFPAKDDPEAEHIGWNWKASRRH